MILCFRENRNFKFVEYMCTNISDHNLLCQFRFVYYIE